MSQIRARVIFLLVIFIMLFAVFYKEHVFYLASLDKCYRVGEACISFKSKWYKNYLIEFLEKNDDRHNQLSINSVTLGRLNNTFVPDSFSANDAGSMLVIYKKDISEVLLDAKSKNSEVVNFSWGQVFITPGKYFEIENDRVLVPDFNLVIFPDEVEMLEDILSIE